MAKWGFGQNGTCYAGKQNCTQLLGASYIGNFDNFIPCTPVDSACARGFNVSTSQWNLETFDKSSIGINLTQSIPANTSCMWGFKNTFQAPVKLTIGEVSKGGYTYLKYFDASATGKLNT